MLTIDEGKSNPGPSGSILAVAAIQFLGSVVLLVPASLFLFEDVQLYYRYPSSYRPLHPAVYVVYVALPIGFSLLGIITSVGLCLLREWARKLTLCLAVAPATVYTVLVILRPPSVFTGGIGDIYLYAVEGALFLLIPVSLWWVILFTRARVQKQFQSRMAAKSTRA
jgi:hypothetical protein